MEIPKSVTIDDLARWSETILSSLRHRGVTEIKIDRQYYWSLNSEVVWSREPPAVEELGDVYDDILDLNRDSETEIADRALYPWHTIDHFIGILTLISAQSKDGELVAAGARNA